MSAKIENKFDYKPLFKVKDQVISKRDGEIGIIKRIDNLCSKIYDEGYDNPGHLEYYVKWHGAWSRHYCFEVDANVDTEIMALTKAGKILYGKSDIRKTKKNRRGA